MPSVIEAAMNSAEARISFSPFALLSRLVDRTHMSSGIIQMRINVMELGRFTRKTAMGVRPCRYLIILHRDSRKQRAKGQVCLRLQALPRGHIQFGPKPQ